MNATITHTIPCTLQINVEDMSAIRNVKSLLRQLKGVVSVKEIKEPKVEMTEEEFYAKIDHSIASAQTGKCFAQAKDESMEDFVNRMLCTK